MIQRWKKIKCFLTGGHKYSDSDLMVSYSLLNRKYYFKNNCIKCGKPLRFSLEREKLY